MKSLLILILLAAVASVLLKDTPIAEQVKVHIIAIQRHAEQIAAERSAAKSQQEHDTPVYAINDLFEITEKGTRSISKGTRIHIVNMAGDQVTVSDGTTTLNTTTDNISNLRPISSANLPGAGPAPPSAPPEPSRLTPQQELHNATIRARIEALEREIFTLSELARVSGARGTRARLDMQRLEVQRTNLERQLH